MRSTTVEPAAVTPRPPPNMSDSPPPRPLWSSTRMTEMTPEMTCRQSVRTNIEKIAYQQLAISGTCLRYLLDIKHAPELYAENLAL